MVREIVPFIFTFLLIMGQTDAFMETTMPNEYMVCKPVAGVFGTLDDGKKSSSGLMPVLQGPEGGAGSPGKTGLPGPQGEPDYTKVSQIVEARLGTINSRLYKMEKDLNALKSGGGVPSPGASAQPVTTQSPEDIKYGEDCYKRFKSPMHMGSMCYKIIGGEGLLWTFKEAESNCTKLGGYLADLNSRAEYDMIYDYVDRTYSTVVEAWTGMRYVNEKLTKTDGKEPSFAKWMAYNPRKYTTYSTYLRYTYVYANIDTSSRINGLMNIVLTRTLSYAICHFDSSGDTTTRMPTTPTAKTESSYYDDYDYYDYNYGVNY